MAGSAGDIFGPGGAVGDIFGGVGDMFQASGYRASAKAYAQGAEYAKQNAQIAHETSQLQEIQAQRQIEQTIGGQKAEVGAAGLASGGSAQYLLKQSINQGALTKQLISLQGAINVNAYNEEATAMTGQAAAASAAAKASTASGIGSIIAGIGEAALFFSDAGLKENIKVEGVREDGIHIISYNYAGQPERWLGVLAQEVQSVRPDCVVKHAHGFLMVDYGKLGATFGQIGHA